MIKIGLLFSVDGDTNEHLESNIVSTVEEYCTLCLGCADGRDANYPDISEHIVGNVIRKLKSKARKRIPGWEEVPERHRKKEGRGGREVCPAATAW